LSDHSGTVYPGLAAAALGASLLEVHVALSRDDTGPDVNASVTAEELRQLVDGVRFIEAALASPVDKDTEAGRLAPLRAIFTKSVVARRDLPKGTILTADDLTVKKPGTGISAAELETLIGRSLSCDVEADDLLQTEHLDPKDKI
jgi:N-acetylneuraminate synthase